MKTRTIKQITEALNAYSAIEAPEVVGATIEGLDDQSLGVLHGISGVFLHAVSARMPAKWLRQIHGDLLDAFCALAGIAHEERSAR